MVKNKNYFYLSEGMENCRMSGKKSGKSQGILRWMISGNPAKVNLVCEDSKLHIEEHM